MKIAHKLLAVTFLTAALLTPSLALAREGLPDAAAENLAVFETAPADSPTAAAQLCYRLRNNGYDARVLKVTSHDQEEKRSLVQCWILMPNNTWKDMIFDPYNGVYYHFGLMEILRLPLKGNSMVRQAGYRPQATGQSEGEGLGAKGVGTLKPNTENLTPTPKLGRDFWQDVSSVTVHNTIPQEAKLKRLTGFGVTINSKPVTGVDLAALTDGRPGTARFFPATNRLEIVLDFSSLKDDVGVVTINFGNSQEAPRSFSCAYYSEPEQRYVPLKSFDGTKTYYEIFMQNRKPKKLRLSGLAGLKEKGGVRIADIGAWSGK